MNGTYYFVKGVALICVKQRRRRLQSLFPLLRLCFGGLELILLFQSGQAVIGQWESEASSRNARSAKPPVPLQARKMWRGDHRKSTIFEWVVRVRDGECRSETCLGDRSTAREDRKARSVPESLQTDGRGERKLTGMNIGLHPSTRHRQPANRVVSKLVGSW